MSFAGGRDTSGAWENHAEPDGRVDEIAWTLDPREVRKEHFNVACRATFSVRYLPDLYSKRAVLCRVPAEGQTRCGVESQEPVYSEAAQRRTADGRSRHSIRPDLSSHYLEQMEIGLG